MEDENLEDQFEALENDQEYREHADEHTSYEQLLEDPYALWIAPELVRHVEAVLKKLPKNVIRKLIDRHILIFAPDKFKGLCLDLCAYDEDRVLIYLSSSLAEKPSDQIRQTIAHELAHVVLGHSDEPTPDAATVGEFQESQSDQLAEQWGFPRPAGQGSDPR
jgi:hypothetical protein